MKRTTLLATMLACFAIGKASAQTVNGIKLSDLKEPYLEFHAYKQALSSKVLVSLEYGQKVVNDRQAAIVKDNNGRNMGFNSTIDFLNKMKEYNYELFEAYAVSFKDDNVTKFYVLKRRD